MIKENSSFKLLQKMRGFLKKGNILNYKSFYFLLKSLSKTYFTASRYFL